VAFTRQGAVAKLCWQPELAFGSTPWLQVSGLTDFFPGGHSFRQFKCKTELRKLPGSVAGDCEWLLMPGSDGRFGAFGGILWLKMR
jgi:hypothetical protein